MEVDISSGGAWKVPGLSASWTAFVAAFNKAHMNLDPQVMQLVGLGFP